ncbi:MAG: 5'/3'-nucleotidase SurE [Clostridia bacterium]|nr:5'/3'-nucleotidase SurE [Clostridia bacterium]
MNILVANDDGIEARGLRELVDALHERAGADVYVFAPDGQRSAVSHAITLGRKVPVWQVDYRNAELAFAMDGTPADCVALGEKILRDKGIKIDMVFAGINHGSNVGTDTVYSGTVGAAVEGSIQGYPSVAVSVDSHQASHFEYACDLAVDTIAKTGGRWNSEIVININTPNLPKDEIKGVRYTVIGDREYINDVQYAGTEGERAYYIYGGEAIVYEHDTETIDVLAIQNGYASITPLHKDMTATYAKADIEKWRIGK